MPEFLTRRNGTWHFVRRVPFEFAEVDRRRIVRHSTRIRITHDPVGRRAARVAEKFNERLELTWKDLALGQSRAEFTRYEDVRQRARLLGYEYLDNAILLERPSEARLERLEALVAKGVVNDASARAALLGTEKRPVFMLSKLFKEFEVATKDEVRDFSPNQLRIWRNGRIRAVENFVSVVGDKLVTELTDDDAIDYAEWWRSRVLENGMAAKSANKDIGQISRMLKKMSVWRRLNLPDVFKGLRVTGEVDKSPCPYETEFIQNRLLAEGALASLNEEARFVLYVIVETGLRPSEVVNLTPQAIRLNAPVPHVKIMPEGRRLKTEDSAREIPLVGVALAAMKLRPEGFSRYRDKSSGLSATLNKYLSENGLRPTRDHTVYSLRHSFKDRLVAVEAPDSLIDSLMGHKTYKPKYGKGPSLELKLKFLQRISLRAPASL
jgi:site-specific recombinase XerD